MNPYREMVSDMVRYTKLPFCGLRPFLRMVADVAKAAVEAGCASNSFLNDARPVKLGSRGQGDAAESLRLHVRGRRSAGEVLKTS